MALILVVDDERPIRELLAAFFEGLGHRAVTAANGQEALDRVGKEVPDLVVTDLMMPVMDGAELVRRLRADAATASVPVVVASAVHNAAQLADVQAFVPKPFDLDKMEDLVAQLLAR